jgi:hypothetical protein
VVGGDVGGHGWESIWSPEEGCGLREALGSASSGAGAGAEKTVSRGILGVGGRDGSSEADGVDVDVGSGSATSTFAAGNEVPAVTRVYSEGLKDRGSRAGVDLADRVQLQVQDEV